jgi:cobalamin biosynthesis Mg chelatase CobN
MDDTEVRVKANVATTSVAPETPAEVTTTTVAVDTPIEITSPPEIAVDPTATDYSCTSECVKGIAVAAGLPDGVVSVSVDGGAPVVLTGENAVALTSGSSKLEFSVAASGTTKSITSGVKRSAGAKQTDIPAATSDTTVAPAEESDTTVAASDTTAAETETETSDDSSGSSPILWIIIALIVIAVIAYLVRRSQASKA